VAADHNDLNAFLAVTRAGGFRDGARAISASASGVSEAVRCHGRPEHPRELLGHACLRSHFSSGAMMVGEFERGGSELVRAEPKEPLLVGIGAATNLAVDGAT